MKYFLKGFWQEGYDEVTKEQHRAAEKIAGKFEGGRITTFFDEGGISGKVEIKEGD